MLQSTWKGGATVKVTPFNNALKTHKMRKVCINFNTILINKYNRDKTLINLDSNIQAIAC